MGSGVFATFLPEKAVDDKIKAERHRTPLSKLVEKLPAKAGKILAWVLIVFMIFDAGLSSLALSRYNERNTAQTEAAGSKALEEFPQLNAFLDAHFPNERMEKIYPNAKLVANMDKK